MKMKKMMIPKSWTGKKTQTNPEFKEKHKQRKIKKALINYLKTQDWELEVYNYNNKKET